MHKHLSPWFFIELISSAFLISLIVYSLSSVAHNSSADPSSPWPPSSIVANVSPPFAYFSILALLFTFSFTETLQSPSRLSHIAAFRGFFSTSSLARLSQHLSFRNTLAPSSKVKIFNCIKVQQSSFINSTVKFMGSFNNFYFSRSSPSNICMVATKKSGTNINVKSIDAFLLLRFFSLLLSLEWPLLT